MLNALAQATYTYTTTNVTGDEKGAVAAMLAFMASMFIIIIPLVIFAIVCMWKVFEKAGVEGWKSIIPVYNGWVMAEIAGKPGWWGIVGLGGIIPFLGIFASIAAMVLYVLIAIELAKSFGKEPVFALVLIFLNIIGFAILAFGSAKYVGPGGKASAKPAAPAKA